MCPLKYTNETTYLKKQNIEITVIIIKSVYILKCRQAYFFEIFAERGINPKCCRIVAIDDAVKIESAFKI